MGIIIDFLGKYSSRILAVFVAGIIVVLFVRIWKIAKKKNFFQKSSVAIQAISTILLVIVTAVYAISSWNMANIMKYEFTASNRPYVGIIDEDMNINNKDYRIELNTMLSNTGTVPAIITWVGTTIPKSEKKFDAIVLHPGENREQLIAINQSNFNGDLPLKVWIEYYSILDKERGEKYCIQYDYEFDRVSDAACSSNIGIKLYLTGSKLCE